MTATQEPTAKAPTEGSVRVRQFDADRHDQSLALDEALAAKPTERQLLWIDISEELDAEQAKELADAFELDSTTIHAMRNPGDVPHLGVHGSYLHVRVAVEPNDRKPDATPWLDIVGGGNVVITNHRVPIQFLDDMDDRIQADTTFGLLDASTFVSSLLGAAVTTYFAAVDAIEDDVDVLDAKSLRDDGRHELLDDLVLVRRRIARLRRVLTDHRQLFASLAGAELAHADRQPGQRTRLQGGLRALRLGDRRGRGQPGGPDRFVRRLHDPNGTAHQRHHEGPCARDRPAPAGLRGGGAAWA